MRYRIKRMASKEKARERIFLVACVMLYFLCFALSETFENYDFPEWMFQTHRHL